MPGRNYTGSGSFCHQNGTVTKNIRFGNGVRDFNFIQKKITSEMMERKLNSYLGEDESLPSLRVQLGRLGLQLRDIPADGLPVGSKNKWAVKFPKRNCLFRALGDQLEGHSRNHFKHRTGVVNFMRSHRHDFEPFIEDGMSFDDHVKALQRLGTHAGNDAIVAFAKLHKVNIVIHQLNGRTRIIHGTAISNDNIHELHLSYHNGDHYSSVRKIDDSTESPNHICLQDLESEMRTNHLKPTPSATGGVVSAKRALEDIEAQVAFATNCKDMEMVRQVLVECDYDVDASIADLVRQMRLHSKPLPDDMALLNSQELYTTNSGVFQLFAANSACSSPNLSSGRIAGSVLKTNGHSYHNGKGHKVHFRDDSVGSSSGYESLSSNTGGKVVPKIIAVQQVSERTQQEPDKINKRQAKERTRKDILEVHQNIPLTKCVRDVAVVCGHNEKLTRF